MKITDVIQHDPMALHTSDVEALVDTFSDAVTIYAKHLNTSGKTLVYYETAQEGLDDPERYGSVWVSVDGFEGFMRLHEPE